MAILEFLNLTWKIDKFRKIWIFEHNSALKYSMVKKFRLRRLNVNSKKIISIIFELYILRVKITKFRKVHIFKHNSALNYLTMKKFHTRALDLNNNNNKKKQTHFTILKFLNLKYRRSLNFEKLGFSNITRLWITP